MSKMVLLLIWEGFNMNHYLNLVPKYLLAHKKKTRLIIVGVAIAVALITSIFSMLDNFLVFQKMQVIYDQGDWHISLDNASKQEKNIISSRLDVDNSGTMISLKNGTINEKPCRIDALDKEFAMNLRLEVINGTYPVKQNEIMLEKWAMDMLNIKLNDQVNLTFANGTNKEMVVSGICNDFAFSKARSRINCYLSIKGANAINEEKLSTYFIKFKDKVKINEAQRSIQNSLNINADRFSRNEMLIAIMGGSINNTVMGLYITGAVLFFIVLIAGVIMIYNTFNISVMQRIHQFGLLRCIGTSKKQIKKIVRREGMYIVLRAIPLGVAAGLLLSFVCSAILRVYNESLFEHFTVLRVSIMGIAAGILIGFATVFLASYLPAKKASRVSPISAVTGYKDVSINKKKKRGILMKIFNIDTAMGINNAIIKKKSLILMSSSIAISIIMFLGFQVLIDFMHSSMKTTKPYTPDIIVMNEKGIDQEIYNELSSIKGIKKIYGRKFEYVNATFDVSKLTKEYKQTIGTIEETENNLFIPPENSWLISYDKNQLDWAKKDLIKGSISEKELDEQNGVIAISTHLRNNVTYKTTNFNVGDKIYIQTTKGQKEMTIKAIIKSVPFSSKRSLLTTFITTEKQFERLMGLSDYGIINIQLKDRDQKATIASIRETVDDTVEIKDSRQKNKEMDQQFFTMAVFVYGFVAVISLISILNIINTMSTSVATKLRYYGVMRAIGMSGKQLSKMVLAEALTYSIIGWINGCLLGSLLQWFLISNYLSMYDIIWKIAFTHILFILIIILFITIISIISPIRRVKNSQIIEVIGLL